MRSPFSSAARALFRSSLILLSSICCGCSFPRWLGQPRQSLNYPAAGPSTVSIDCQQRPPRDQVRYVSVYRVLSPLIDNRYLGSLDSFRFGKRSRVWDQVCPRAYTGTAPLNESPTTTTSMTTDERKRNVPSKDRLFFVLSTRLVYRIHQLSRFFLPFPFSICLLSILPPFGSLHPPSFLSFLNLSLPFLFLFFFFFRRSFFDHRVHHSESPTSVLFVRFGTIRCARATRTTAYREPRNERVVRRVRRTRRLSRTFFSFSSSTAATCVVAAAGSAAAAATATPVAAVSASVSAVFLLRRHRHRHRHRRCHCCRRRRRRCHRLPPPPPLLFSLAPFAFVSLS